MTEREQIMQDMMKHFQQEKEMKRARYRQQNAYIRKGQTLSQIAKANGTTVAKLKRLNGIKGNNIRAGKKLRVK